MKLYYLICCLFITNLAFSQTINLDHYNKRIFMSEFNSAKDAKLWPSVNGLDEINLINNEEYTVELKSYPKDRYIFPDWHNTYPDYELDISLSMKYMESKEQTAGVCFGFSKGQEQGYILELNNKKQFRIKNIKADGKIIYITGSNSKNSWQKFNMLYPKDNSNEINILVLGNTVDVYLNNFLAFSFQHNSPYYFHDFGVMVGRNSKAVFMHVYLLIHNKDYGKYDHITEEVNFYADKVEPIKNSKEIVVNEQPKDSLNKGNTTVSDNSTSTKDTTTQIKDNDVINDPDVKKCLDMIVNLRKDLNEIEKDRDNLQRLLEACKDDNARLNEFILMNMDDELQKKVTRLEIENGKLKDEFQRLKTENTTLQDFKKFYQNQNKDTDIVNFLYDELKKIEEKNAYLARQVEILQEQLNNQKLK